MSEFKHQFAGALLVVLTVAAVFAALINFQEQQKYRLPTDGVLWMERGGAVVAHSVEPGGPGDRQAIHPGDRLVRIQRQTITSVEQVAQALFDFGPYRTPEYAVLQHGVEVRKRVILAEATPSPATYYMYAVGVAYLLIGLLVYFRRRTAPKAAHFYCLCLASFVLATFHYTGKLNNFDKVVYWGNVVAGYIAPTLFLHFALVFPESKRWLRSAWRQALLYVPAAVLLLMHFAIARGQVQVNLPTSELRWLLDRGWLAFWSAFYVAGTLALAWRYPMTGDPVVRQQLRWLRNGAVLGVLPFTLFYAVPYAMGVVPTPSMDLAVLSLPLIPLTWAYAIVRHRLLEVDVIFQQGYLYTLATIFVLGLFYAVLFSLGNFDQKLTPTAVVVLILIATFLFQPIRNYMEENLNRYYFYRDRYDYRQTLIEFARELSTETNLEKMLNSVAERLLHTLSLAHVAFFIHNEQEGRFELRMRAGDAPELKHWPDLAFLNCTPDKPYYFVERTRSLFDFGNKTWPTSVRQTLADLDLTYYLPCMVRGKTIAYIGVSRTTNHDFLASEDVELLTTLARYVGIAVESSRLYYSLERKAQEVERLKEYNENIVESINVGVLTTDLSGKVESWNNQMERLTGLTREMAVGRHLSRLLPAELFERVNALWHEHGAHHQ